MADTITNHRAKVQALKKGNLVWYKPWNLTFKVKVVIDSGVMPDFLAVHLARNTGSNYIDLHAVTTVNKYQFDPELNIHFVPITDIEFTTDQEPNQMEDI